MTKCALRLAESGDRKSDSQVDLVNQAVPTEADQAVSNRHAFHDVSGAPGDVQVTLLGKRRHRDYALLASDACAIFGGASGPTCDELQETTDESAFSRLNTSAAGLEDVSTMALSSTAS